MEFTRRHADDLIDSEVFFLTQINKYLSKILLISKSVLIVTVLASFIFLLLWQFYFYV